MKIESTAGNASHKCVLDTLRLLPGIELVECKQALEDIKDPSKQGSLPCITKDLCTSTSSCDTVSRSSRLPLTND
jgi:hypothetical protein